MAKIYISYNHADRELAIQISSGLKAQGHQITLDVESLAPGQDWRAALSEGLKASEVFVALLTESSLKSQFVLSEIGAAQAYMESTGRLLLIPVIADQIEIPPIVRHINAIFSPDHDVDYILQELGRAIAAFEGQRAAKEEREVEVRKRIEKNTAEYVDDVLQSLDKGELRNRRAAFIWYVLGFATLVLGVAFGLYSLSNIGAAVGQSWTWIAVITLKSVIVVGLLIACSKYSFALGKSYMTEALKSSDRRHAIHFGKFYLRAYGIDASWTELKEVFQHWNIDKSSAFSGLDPAQYDPKFLDSAINLVKALSELKEGRKS